MLLRVHREFYTENSNIITISNFNFELNSNLIYAFYHVSKNKSKHLWRLNIRIN